MRIVIFGPQGAGKGTQSSRIAEKYGIHAIATGDIFRWAIRSGSDLGRQVLNYVENGELVPDDLTISVVRKRLEAEPNGWLLDGFPRTVEQSDALEKLLADQGARLDAALVIEVPDDVAIARITGRRICSNCGRNYSPTDPPKVPGVCDRCDGEIIERKDDSVEEAVRQRLRSYHERTEPLKAYYEERGLLRTVKGVGTVDEVFDRIVAQL